MTQDAGRKSQVALVVAMAENRVIGRGNALPWRLPDDLKFFKQLTTGHTVIMGRKTFESVGKPLPNRRNIVVTRSGDFRADGVEIAHDLGAAVALAAGEPEIFIVGGGQIYQAALPLADRIYLTLVHTRPEGDAFFPPLDERQWKLVSDRDHPADEKHSHPMSFRIYERRD